MRKMFKFYILNELEKKTCFSYCVVSHLISEHDDHEFGGHGHHGGDHGFGHGFGDDHHDHHDHDPFGGHGMGNGHGHHGGHHDKWDKHGSKHKGIQTNYFDVV